MFKLTTSIISWLCPPLCVHCRREGAWLCPQADHIIAAEPVWSELLVLPHVDQVFIRGSYDCLPLQQLIHQLKYSYWHAAQTVLPDVLAPVLPQLQSLPPDTIIVPVPLHTRRQRERGFNQAELIAHALSQITGWPVKPLLLRHRYTVPQAQLTAKLRQTNMIDAFITAKQFASMPSSVILVDDVLTTGSTLSECAKALRQSGVGRVFAGAIAKG